MAEVKKILIIGSKGMAGHIIFHYFKEKAGYEIIDIARGKRGGEPSYDLDVTDFDLLKSVILQENPSYVINCIGILNQDAENHPDKAILLNTYFPHFLAALGTQIGFSLIHISTDCVFSGKNGGYTEDSIKDGIGFYAQSKALGEIVYGNHLTLRTSIVGPEIKKEGIGLFHWFMQQEGNIKGYSEAYWTGVTTIELAKAIDAAIYQNVTGLFHLVNNDKISKYDLIGIFKGVFDKDNLKIEKYEGYKIDKSLIKTRTGFNYQVPSYEDMIVEMKAWIDDHRQWYSY